MPDLRLGSTVPTAMKLGTVNVSKAYLGSTLVWPLAACTDVLSEPFNTLANWTTEAGSPSIVAGRTGTAVKLPSSGLPARIRYTIPSVNESDTVTVGFAFKISGFGGAEEQFLQLWSDSNTVQHTVINITTTGTIKVMRGANVLAISTATITANTWTYLEVQAKLHDTAGFVTVRMNGTPIVSVSGVDTRNAGTKTTYDTLIFPPLYYDLYVDDLYILTGSGCAFKGDQIITTPNCDLLMEPFNTLANWTTISGSPSIVAGRTGTAVSVPSNAGIRYTIPSANESDTITFGCALRFSGLGSECNLIEFASDANATTHDSLRYTSAGELKLYNGAGSLIGYAAAGLAANTWHYIEVQLKLADSGGTLQVKVNGNTVMGPTTADTRNGGTKITFDTVRLNPQWFNVLYDDLYISTGSGCAFKGSITIP